MYILLKKGSDIIKKKLNVGNILAVLGLIICIVGVSLFFITNYTNFFDDYDGVTTEDYSTNVKIINGSNDNKSSKFKTTTSNNSNEEYSNSSSSSQSKIYVSNKLYRDMVEYNKKLPAVQLKKMVNEKVLEKPFLHLSQYGLPNSCIGTITIDKINLDLPIYLGASDYHMSLGATHLNYTSAPIGGKNTNCVIGGHTGYIGRTFFDNLRALSQGDIIKVKNFWHTLKYKVIETKTVVKDDTSVLYIQKGKDLVTLFTCISNNNGGFNRYVVVAERI